MFQVGLGVLPMESFSRFVSQYIPWFWVLLAWSFAIFALLAVLTIPYFIVYPIATNLRRGMDSYLSRLFARHATARETRKRSMDLLIEDFRRNSGISYISERITRLEAALASFSEVAKALKTQLNRFLNLPQTFERMGTRLTEAAGQGTPAFPDILTAEQLSVQHGSLRTAKGRLFVSSIILIALISVNTGMLGQILKDLGFIPHDRAYFGIPLYLVFAFILTLVEAGLGYVHAAGRPAPGTPEKEQCSLFNLISNWKILPRRDRRNSKSASHKLNVQLEARYCTAGSTLKILVQRCIRYAGMFGIGLLPRETVASPWKRNSYNRPHFGTRNIYERF
jgi:hypothetical protein